MKTLVGEVLCDDAGSYAAATPFGFGVINSGALTRIPVGARLSGPRGYSLASNVTDAPAYVKTYNTVSSDSTRNAYVSFFIKFTSFSTHAGVGEYNVIVDFFNALSSGAPVYYPAGVGAHLSVKQDGTLKITTNVANDESVAKLTLGVWYKVIVESISYATGYRFFYCSFGPADGSGPMYTFGTSSTNTQDCAYLGLTNRGESGNAVGADYVVSGFRCYSTTYTHNTYSVTGNISDGSTTVSSISDDTNIAVGTIITGKAFQRGTTVESVDHTAHTMVLSAAPNATATGRRFFFWPADHVDETAEFPTDLLAPPAGPFNRATTPFWIRGDAEGGGDGTANDAAHAMTWDEACIAAPYIATHPTTNWVYTDGGDGLDASTLDADVIAFNFRHDFIRYSSAGTVFIMGSSVSGATRSFATLTPSAISCELDGNGYTVDGTVPLVMATAVQYDAENYPNVWKIACPQKTILFRGTTEAGIWLHRAAGSAIATGAGYESGTEYTTVAAAIDTVPDTQWNDDAGFMYFSTPDGEAPTSHSYFRTMANPGSTLGVYSLVNIDGYLHDITIKGLMGMNGDGSAVATYAFLLSDYDLTIANNVTTRYMGYHSGGTNSGGSDGRVVVIGAALGPGWPSQNATHPYWCSAGGQNPLVFFNSNAAATGSQVYCENITTPDGTDGLAGSTDGFDSDGTAALLSHNGGSGTQYTAIYLVNSQLGGSVSIGNLATDVYVTTDCTATSFDITNQTAYTRYDPPVLDTIKVYAEFVRVFFDENVTGEPGVPAWVTAIQEKFTVSVDSTPASIMHATMLGNGAGNYVDLYVYYEGDGSRLTRANSVVVTRVQGSDEQDLINTGNETVIDFESPAARMANNTAAVMSFFE